MNLAVQFNLEADVLKAHAEAYYGFALAPREAPRRTPPPAAQLDYLTIAASYWAVVDQKRSRECFREAATRALNLARQAQKEENRLQASEWAGRAFTLSGCANDVLTENPRKWIGDEIKNVRLMAAALMTTVAYGQRQADGGRQVAREYLGGLKELAAPLGSHPVGRMRIPLSLYLELADVALPTEGRPEERSLRNWIQEFGVRVTQEIRLAQSTGHHWANLYTSLLPIEPEVLGAIMILVRARPDRLRELPLFETASEPMRAYGQAASAIIRGEE